MKKLVFKYSLFIAAFFTIAVSCNKSNETTVIDKTKLNPPTSDSLIRSDSTNLTYDSATVKTAVGVQDEEQNAIKQEQLDGEKLQEDKK